MKRFLLIICLLSPVLMQAQITLTAADFPSANDTARVSIAYQGTAVNFDTTGAGIIWDFSYLLPQSQAVDSFLSVGSTGIIYSFYFANSGLSLCRSNIAVSGGTLPAIPGSPVTLSDPYGFFYKSSSSYKQTGIGISISGIQAPQCFTIKDTIYNFPMNYLNSDSCRSQYSISVPNLGSYYNTTNRKNTVDGWGTLISPYGTFNVLRVKTELSGRDSIHSDSLGIGFGANRALTKEYKWFAQGQKIPLLQINTRMTGTNEIVTAIRYRDSLRVTASIAETELRTGSGIFPNPAGDAFTLYTQTNMAETATLEICDEAGRIIIHRIIQLTPGMNQFLVNDLKEVNSGIYFVSVKKNSGKETFRLVHN